MYLFVQNQPTFGSILKQNDVVKREMNMFFIFPNNWNLIPNDNLILTDDNTACGGTPPGPTTAPPPPTPSTGCESPQWANDQWCDDENNNADCNYDGGACCNNNVSGMNANSRSLL